MNISPISNTNFGARTVLYPPVDMKDANKAMYGKQRILDSYDRQIKAIKAQKDEADLLISAIATSPKAQQLIKQLPEGDEVVINAGFSVDRYSSSYSDDLQMERLSLSYKPVELGSAIKYSSLDIEDQKEFMRKIIQDKNGMIDQKGIIEWLNKLVDVFGREK